MDAYVKNMMVGEDNQGGVNAQLTRYTRLINLPYHEQRRGRVSGSLCKIVEGYESSNQALWLCWCSAVGARLNSAWEMEQKLIAPGHCYLKGAGR